MFIKLQFPLKPYPPLSSKQNSALLWHISNCRRQSLVRRWCFSALASQQLQSGQQSKRRIIRWCLSLNAEALPSSRSRSHDSFTKVASASRVTVLYRAETKYRNGMRPPPLSPPIRLRFKIRVSALPNAREPFPSALSQCVSQCANLGAVKAVR